MANASMTLKEKAEAAKAKLKKMMGKQKTTEPASEEEKTRLIGKKRLPPKPRD